MDGLYLKITSLRHIIAGVVSTFYAMREALAIVGEEGLSAMWDRHLAAHQQLWKGLGELGLEPFVPEAKDRSVSATNKQQALGC